MSPQVSENISNKKHVSEMNQVLGRILKANENRLWLLKLETCTAKLVAISDTSVANKSDLSSQRSQIIMQQNHCWYSNALRLCRHKFKHVARPVLGAETYAFVDYFETVITMHNGISNVFRRRIPINILMESAFLFSEIVGSSNTA